MNKNEAPTILLVDDDSNFRATIKRSLRNEPYRVVTAESAVGAIELMSVLKPQVIVSDLCMPTIDGSELLSYFKTNHPTVVRIMLSGKFQVNDVLSAVNNNNVFRCLSKPCAAELLSNTLKEALQHSEFNSMKESEIKKLKLQSLLTEEVKTPDQPATQSKVAIVIDDATVLEEVGSKEFSSLINEAVEEVDRIDKEISKYAKNKSKT